MKKNKESKTVNLHVHFKAPSGEVIGGEKATTVADQIGLVMFQLHQIGGQPVDGAKKYLAYKIVNKITTSPTAVVLSDEEKELIEAVAAESFSAGVFGQIMDIINA